MHTSVAKSVLLCFSVFLFLLISLILYKLVSTIMPSSGGNVQPEGYLSHLNVYKLFSMSAEIMCFKLQLSIKLQLTCAVTEQVQLVHFVVIYSSNNSWYNIMLKGEAYYLSAPTSKWITHNLSTWNNHRTPFMTNTVYQWNSVIYLSFYELLNWYFPRESFSKWSS